ncbi:MAG: ribonuclease catalytic domain-containing protein [Candidatus Gracilibacteria bacterium]|nr:ribonuclease catalytic domain-containing protein [Candidatus Gracilibacteria bacterium]
MKLPKITDSIHNTYSPLALKELKGISKRVKGLKEAIPKEFASRREITGITIDQYYSRDLDDGIWAYRDGDNHVLQGSIADIAELIQTGAYLDWEALSRATSVYYETHVLHMFPEQLSTDIASLNHQCKRLAMTVEVVLDANYDIVSIDVFESVFFNKHGLDYQKFAQILRDKNDPMSPDLSYFLEIAKNLAPKRKHMKFSDDDRKIAIGLVDFDELPNSNTTENPSFLIEEFMILFNMAVARWMVERGIVATFRNHMPEYKDKDFKGNMQRAFYHPRMIYHFALGLDFYCHFSSPIRRYSDIVVHRQIKAFLNPEKWQAYNFFAVKHIALYINEQIYNLRNLQLNKELEDEEKRHERILNKVAIGESVEDFSRISIHLFEEILDYVLERNLLISSQLRGEMLNRLDADLIKGELLYRLFFCNDELVANKAFYRIHMTSKQKAFFSYLENTGDFSVVYSKRRDYTEYMHYIAINYKGDIAASFGILRKSQKSAKEEMLINLFSKFREWRDNYYYKKEKRLKSFA